MSSIDKHHCTMKSPPSEKQLPALDNILPEERLLLGPGPSNIPDTVNTALSYPMVGCISPSSEILAVGRRYRIVWNR